MKTNAKVSLSEELIHRYPSTVSLAEGVVGMGIVVVGKPAVSVAVTRLPLVIVGPPLMVAPAVQVLATVLAVKGPT